MARRARIRMTASKRAEIQLSTQHAAPPVGPPVNIALPAIAGTVEVGQTLTASHGAWTNSPAAYEYQWLTILGIIFDIVGETGPAYTITGAVPGEQIAVTVVARNASGEAEA